MGKYLLAYRGGEVAGDEEERNAAMAAWGQWLGQLGAAIVDPGNPFAGSSTVGAGGSVAQGGASALTGYTVLNADSLDAAGELAKGCPVLAHGGSVEVYETFEVM